MVETLSIKVVVRKSNSSKYNTVCIPCMCMHAWLIPPWIDELYDVTQSQYHGPGVASKNLILTLQMIQNLQVGDH